MNRQPRHNRPRKPEQWSREEQAKAEVGHTRVSPLAARCVTAVFLAALFSVPVLQHVAGWVERQCHGRTESLSFYAEFDRTGQAMAQAWTRAEGLLDHFLRPNAELLRRINAYQDRLDEVTLLTRWSRSRVQAAMCRLGVGNDKAFVGRDGWLFYEPGLRHLTGPPFLDQRQLRKRARTGNEWRRPPQPDPVLGIVHFRDQLRRHGVELVVMPAPVKPSIHPEKMTRGTARAAPMHNPSYPALRRRLEQAGVHVFDCAPLLLERKRRRGVQYLATDTHWRPEAMQAAAAGLASFIRARGLLPDAPAAAYSRTSATVTNHGDIAVMLQLPEGQTLYPPETVTIAPVVNSSGAAWTNDADAGVLLLGDSFANIYSLGDMGWGRCAGLAEQLSVELQRDVQRIVRNDAGASATRELLATRMARGRLRLPDKKLVVWEFAGRELSVGDWKRIDLRQGESPERPPAAKADGILATGLVADVSDRPQRGAVYRDFVMKLYVTQLQSGEGAPVGDGDAVVHVMGMRNRSLLPVASVRAGQTLKLRLRPWEEVEQRYGSMKSGSLADPMLEIEKALYWGEVQ